MTPTKHQQDRKDRAEAKADNLRSAAEAQLERARRLGEHIPFGQPILVGHHSEKRHRRDIARIQGASSKGVDLLRQADSASHAADGAGQSISSDDPEALEALAEKLAGLEEKREVFKAHNRKARKAGGEVLPRYVLTNLGANIRSVRARIETLERAAIEPEREPIEGEGWRIEEDKLDNRVRVILDKKHPDWRVLKSLGFRWSRNNGAWQRQLNNAGRYAAEQAIRKLFGDERQPRAGE